MGIWNFYFIAKLFLFGGRFIDFHVIPNLVFACLLIIPIKHPRLQVLRHVIAVPIAVALLYYDTWLPPISRLFSQASLLQGFTLTYALELLGRFIHPFAIIGLVLLAVVYYFASKKLRRITPFVFAAMLVPLLPIFTPAPAAKKLEIAFQTNDALVPTAESGALTPPTPPKTPSVEAASTLANAAPTPSANKATEKSVTAAADSAASSGKSASPKADNITSETAKSSAPADVHNAAAGNVSGPATEAVLNASLNAFYKQEAARKVTFTSKPTDPPFDIIFLQICSLSWDDLDIKKERNNALFKRFNIVFTNFSSAATYSGPAVIRALRGSCGQQKHGGLYTPFSPQCLTFNNLQQIGFETQLAMNHDGRFGGLVNDLRERGGMKAPLFDTNGTPPYLKSFDGSPIQNDYSVLSKWWEKRQQTPASRVALFYNSVSLHDGNRYADGRPGNSMEIYSARLTKLLSDVDRFIAELQSSGRRAIVVFVPEHGAALRGDKMQISGMREIPSPRISIVPVGIKLIGIPDAAAASPLLVSKPVSYVAISQLLADFIRTSPFGETNLNLEKYVRDLPMTEFVAENDDVVVMRRGKQYFIRSKDAGWTEYDPSE